MKETIGRHVKAVLDKPFARKGEKLRTTLYLTQSTFERFKIFCKNRNCTPSEVLDAVIFDLLEQYERTGMFRAISDPISKPLLSTLVRKYTP